MMLRKLVKKRRLASRLSSDKLIMIPVVTFKQFLQVTGEPRVEELRTVKEDIHALSVRKAPMLSVAPVTDLEAKLVTFK